MFWILKTRILRSVIKDKKKKKNQKQNWSPSKLELTQSQGRRTKSGDADLIQPRRAYLVNTSFLWPHVITVCNLLPQGYIWWHRLTQETISFLLSTFKIFRQDHSFQAQEEARLLQQVFFEGFTHSRQVYSTSVLRILFQLIHKGVTIKGEFCHRPLHLTKETWH